MNSKARVHAALKREPTDRTPIFMWFHPDTVKRLGKLLEIPSKYVSEAMGNDVRQAWVSNNHAMEGITHEYDGEGHTDFWGIEWIKKGPFNQIKRSPLQDIDGKDNNKIRQYKYPYDYIEKLLKNMDPVVLLADDFFVGCDVSPCLFEMVCRIRGMEKAVLDLAADPGLAKKMLEDAGKFAVKISESACERFPLDWLWTGDDVGGQKGMIMSPECWRDMIRPRLSKIFKIGKSKGLWVAYHSCGSIRLIIPDLIEIGLDVLNPVQCNCPGMNPLELKKEFGEKLSFMGGVDTQDLLPNGTSEEVRRETTRLLEGMTADGGGYILAASHIVPPETPLENIFAMYEVAGLNREEILDRAADLRKKGEKV
jgi:uroporphyrinogen decarboxylase